MNILARLRPLCLLLLAPLLLTACVDSDELPDDARGNFEALWRIIDEHYCFFDYKRDQYGLDWNEVYQRYSRQMNDKMTEAQMFEVLTNMLAELRDGHVNLYTAFDVGRYWSWHEDFPRNFSDDLLDRYLGTDYRIVGSLRYRVLPDNTGYIYCGSFQNEFGAGNLDEVLYYLSPCNALIIDVRNNGGGKLTAAEQLAGRFTNEELLVGYMSHKTGKGHNDFSAPEEQKLAPSKGIRWQKPVAVLTNRSVCQVHEVLSGRYRHRRPHRRRSRNALHERAALRLERALLGLSHVRPAGAEHRVRHRPRHQREPERRRLLQRHRHADRVCLPLSGQIAPDTPLPISSPPQTAHLPPSQQSTKTTK